MSETADLVARTRHVQLLMQGIVSNAREEVGKVANGKVEPSSMDVDMDK